MGYLFENVGVAMRHSPRTREKSAHTTANVQLKSRVIGYSIQISE
jgi:hypothetical protein